MWNPPASQYSPADVIRNSGEVMGPIVGRGGVLCHERYRTALGVAVSVCYNAALPTFRF